MERKTLAFSVSEIKEHTNSAGINVAIIEGYAAFKNNLDYGRDRIMDGAFKAGLKKTKGKWPVLIDHNYSMTATVGENITAKEDENGLFVKSEINLDTQIGRETYSQIKHAKSAGRDAGISIGYRADDFEYKTVKNIQERQLKAVTIGEHSFVVFPMNPKATVTTIKSICEEGDAEAIAHKKRSIEDMLKREAGCSEKEAKDAVHAIFADRDGGKAEEELVEYVKSMTSRLNGEK